MATVLPCRTVHVCACPFCQQHPHGHTARGHRDINRLLATLNERQRRLFVGFLARCQGRGAIRRLARITGLSRNTVRRGMRDLGHFTARTGQRIRRPGGGRKRVECLGGIC